MAKTKKKQKTQSDRIRDYIKSHPKAPASEVAKALSVKPNLVYSVKSKSNGKTTKKKPVKAKPKTTPQNGRPSKPSDDAMVHAARLLNTCGSMEEATRVLGAVGRIAETLGK